MKRIVTASIFKTVSRALRARDDQTQAVDLSDSDPIDLDEDMEPIPESVQNVATQLGRLLGRQERNNCAACPSGVKIQANKPNAPGFTYCWLVGLPSDGKAVKLN